ncbi:hypothetical protein [Anaeroselena agilis]|uniref:Uncharacterized protein n=1 Tax=Anaeroselena agilis TaxID=3063788 RepID=A0ABU3P481_9FIRM|nr:hypothetical protein [Selenomonadales bacterium 4137-cl]
MRLKSKKKQKVLLVVNTGSYFPLLFRIARLLKKSGKYEPVIYLMAYPTTLVHLRECETNEIAYLLDNTVKAMLRKANGYLKVYQYLVSVITKNQLIHLLLRIRSVKSLIKDHNIELVVLAGDIIGHDTAVFIKAGHLCGISTVITPFVMGSKLETVYSVMHNPDHSMDNWLNRFVGALFPKWVYEHEGRSLLRVPAGRVIALELLGMAPKLPWIIHSGHSDAIAVESEEMRRYCRQEGLPAEKLVLTGTVAHDDLAVGLKEKEIRLEALCFSLGLNNAKPLILTALPPNMMYGYWRPDCDFDTYEEMVKFWLATLANLKEYNVIVSLHPSVIIDDMEYIEKYGVKITQEKIIDLIPLCDFFVTAVSSTIQWAIACGKPVVNYDVYKYRYADYLKVPGVLTFEEKEKYIEYTNRLAYDKAFFQLYAAKQRSCMKEWGNLDGRAGARLLELFASLMASNGAFRK